MFAIVNGANSALAKTEDLQGNISSHIAQSVGASVSTMSFCQAAALLARYIILSALFAE
jgi:hypothetical protein